MTNQNTAPASTVLSGCALLDGTAVTVDDEPRFGGKAVGLARLDSAGAAVPHWTAIGVEACAEHVRRSGAADLIGRLERPVDAADRAALGEQIAAAITATELSPVLTAALAVFLDGRGEVAVRSSAVGEDGADRSFAGIYESFLYRTGIEQVASSVKDCWASAFSVRALQYAAGDDAVAMQVRPVGVVVQEMAAGQTSGVLFTAHPVSGALDEALVSACWGSAEGVVNGLCATDEFTVAHDGTELAATVAEKDVEVIRADGGTATREIDDDRRHERCLAPAQLSDLVRTAVGLAERLGGPQDIEWTIDGDRIAFLQARPITALAGRVGDWRIVWDNSNIQESFNGVTTPLTFSWAARVYDVIFTETLRMIGVRSTVISEHEKVLRNMVGLVDGRVYYNINNWYRVLKLAPFFDRNKEDVERMIGVEKPVDFIEGTHRTTRERIAAVPQMLPVVATLGWRMANRASIVDAFQDEVGGQVRAIRKELDGARDLEALLDLGDRGLALFSRWAVQILNDLYLSNQAGRARRLLASLGHEEPDEIVAGLLASEEAVESLQPTLILLRLAERIRDDPALTAALETGDGYAELCAASPEVADTLARFIDEFGDRCIGEQKLETISLRQDPIFVARVLRNYVRDHSVGVGTFETAHRERKARFEREVLDSLPPRRRRRLAGIMRKARASVRDRERMRLTRTRIVGLGREVYLRIGEVLHASGQIQEPRDVFYLTMEELSAFAEGRSMTADLASLAAARRAEFAAHGLVEPPNQFETLGPPTMRRGPAAEAQEGTDQRVLTGTGCWPGIVEAPIQVVMSPDDDLDVRGKVMTTMRTDPGWGPLFPSVAALLIERGSTLSHSAVLARELGIPAVVGVPGLMSFISDGERVRLDGGSGRVERLDFPDVADGAGEQ